MKIKFLKTNEIANIFLDEKNNIIIFEFTNRKEYHKLDINFIEKFNFGINNDEYIYFID